MYYLCSYSQFGLQKIYNNRRKGNYEQDELVRLFKEMNYYE